MDEVRGYAAAVLPTAEWKKDGTCSHCGGEMLVDAEFEEWKHSSYCPHCGIKMRNNDDESEDD